METSKSLIKWPTTLPSKDGMPIMVATTHIRFIPKPNKCAQKNRISRISVKHELGTLCSDSYSWE